MLCSVRTAVHTGDSLEAMRGPTIETQLSRRGCLQHLVHISSAIYKDLKQHGNVTEVLWEGKYTRFEVVHLQSSQQFKACLCGVGRRSIRKWLCLQWDGAIRAAFVSSLYLPAVCSTMQLSNLGRF